MCSVGIYVGCGKEAVPLVAVHGRVLVDDQPVTKGTVSFRPDAERGNVSMDQPAGVLQADGSYELATERHLGASPGWYRVLIMADNFEVVDPPPSPVWPDYPKGYLKKPLVHERYLYFKQTDIMVEVKENSDPKDYILRLNP